MATKKSNKNTSKTTKRAKKVGTTPRATKKAEQERALTAKCEKIKKLELAATSDECKSRYGIGVEISAVKKESNTYGTGAVQTIARAIGRDANTLYDYARVAAAWPDAKAFDALCKEKNAVDVPLSFSHFIVLAKADCDEEQRDALRKLALKESLSVAALSNKANPAKEQKPVAALSHTVSSIAKRIGTWQTDLEAHLKGVDAAELSNLTDACDRAAEALQVFANTLREQQSPPRTGPGPASTSKDTSSKAAE